MKLIVTYNVRAAAGHWPQLLPALGISINAAGQHSPCPVCGGKDRFRFDNQAGRGTWPVTSAARTTGWRWLKRRWT